MSYPTYTIKAFICERGGRDKLSAAQIVQRAELEAKGFEYVEARSLDVVMEATA